MNLLRKRNFFSVTNSWTREPTAQIGGRAAGVSNRSSHGGPAALGLDYEWTDEVWFPSYAGHNDKRETQTFQCF